MEWYDAGRLNYSSNNISSNTIGSIHLFLTTSDAAMLVVITLFFLCLFS